MKKFEFTKNEQPSEQLQTTTFTGRVFYDLYKNSEFLRNSANVEVILAEAYKLRHELKNIPPGERLVIQGINIERNTPLFVKKTGPKIKVEDYEFTHNRLTGLVAAYVYDNRHRFPVVKYSDATALGLIWDNCDDKIARLFLSAVSGAEHFCDQFSYWPLLCALRKYQLKKMTLEPLIKIARIKNNEGVRLAKVLKDKFKEALLLWRVFPGSTRNDFEQLLNSAPPEIKLLFT